MAITGSAMFTNPAAAVGTPVCQPSAYAVEVLHGNVLYTDLGSTVPINSSYLGYKITNNSGNTVNLWAGVTDNAPDVSLGASEKAEHAVANLANGATGQAFFYITAAATSASVQPFTLTLYDGVPGAGGAAICTVADQFDSVQDTIKAAANKVTTISVPLTAPVLGSTFTVTVTGQTGTIGAGVAGDPSSFWMSPASTSAWPAGSFQLVSTQVTFASTSASYSNVLHIINQDVNEGDYTATYTFRVAAPTTTAALVTPMQMISSGTQVKHTDPDASAIPQTVPVTVADQTVTKTASVASLPAEGGNVDYTLTVGGTTGIVLDSFVDELPAGATYNAGTAKWDGVTVADPSVSGQTLTFAGPFPYSTAGQALTFSVALPAVAGSYSNHAWALMGTTRIDASADLTASNDATVTVIVGTLDQTITFPGESNTALDKGPVTLDATTDSGLPITYASLTPSICTVDETGTVTLLAVGTCSLSANQPGNGSYNPATEKTISFEVTAAAPAKLDQTITFPGESNTVLNAGPVQLDATVDSNLTITYTSATPLICTVDASGSVTLLAVGTCAINADQPGDESYNPATQKSINFEVTAVPLLDQTITFPGESNTALDKGPVTLDATTDSGLPITYASLTPSICTVDETGTVTLLAVGTCSLSANQPGNGSYNPATEKTISFEVTAAAPAPTPTPTPTPEPTPTPTPTPTPAPKKVEDETVIDGETKDVRPQGGTVTTITQPSAGSVTNVDGNLVYTPPVGYKGTTSYTYRIVGTDGSITDVTVKVVVKNLPPVVSTTPATAPAGNTVNVPAPTSDPNRDDVTLSSGTPSKDVKVTITNGEVTVVPAANVSGKVSIPLIATDTEGLTGTTTLEVTFIPSVITDGKIVVTAPKKVVALNQIVPVTTTLTVNLPANARSAEIIVNGQVVPVTITSSGSVKLPMLIGPSDEVKLVAIGDDATRSEASLVAQSTLDKVALANINFDTASFRLTANAKKILDAAAATIIERGFTVVYLTGHTDPRGAGNKALSANRANAATKYLEAKLRGTGVRFAKAAYAAADPVAKNTSSTGMALNRRVEIAVK